MANFKLLKTVWFDNRPWRAGSEDGLQKAGFSREDKLKQAKLKRLVFLDAAGSAVAEPADENLESLTVQQLRDVAAEEGVDLGKLRKKADIIAAIEEARAASGEGEGDDSGGDGQSGEGGGENGGDGQTEGGTDNAE